MKQQTSLSKKIKSYIVTSCTIFGFILVLLVSSSLLRQYEAINVLNNREKVERVKESFEKELVKIETAVDSIGIQVTHAYNNNCEDSTRNLDDFELELYDMISRMLLSETGVTTDIYVYLSPFLDGEVHDMWLTRDEAGRLHRHSEIPKSRYEENINMDWYYDVQQKSSAGWQKMYFNRYGEAIYSYVIPIFDNDKMIGIAGMYLDLEHINKLLSQFNKTDEAYFWILDANDYLIYHPIHKSGLEVSRIKHSIYGAGWEKKYSRDVIDYEEYRHFVSITSNTWKFIYTIKDDAFTKESNKLIYKAILIFFFALLVFLMINKKLIQRYELKYNHIIMALKQNRLDMRREKLNIDSTTDSSVVIGTINECYKEIDQLKKELETLKHYNRISGMPNWIKMREDLDMYLESSGDAPLCVMDVDLDFFKQINEIFGHEIGDTVLKELFMNLRKIENDHLHIYHTDGDAFVVVLPKVSCDEAIEYANEIHSVVRGIQFDEIYHLDLSCSIGIACYPEHGRTSDELLKFAEVALYTSKEKGKNRHTYFEESMYQQLTSLKELEYDFIDAIEKNQFIVHYQPKFSMDGEMTGIEALVRWQHPQKGLLYPNYFIGYAEQKGLIGQVGDIVLRDACKAFKELVVINKKLSHVAVNISSKQLLEETFVQNILSVLQEESLQYEYLELEITESMLIFDRDVSIGKLQMLKDEGVHISLDDFGSGYASINNIKGLPISRLKIDRSFIHDIEENPRVIKMLSAVAGMAHDLDIVVTAEGVETKRQLTLLHDLEIDEFQGYYLGKPMPLEVLKKLLRQ